MRLKLQIKPAMISSPRLTLDLNCGREFKLVSYLLSFLSTSLVALASNSLEQKVVLVTMSTAMQHRVKNKTGAGLRGTSSSICWF